RARRQLVELGDVGLMVLAVVEVEGLLAHPIRGQRILGVRKWRQFESHKPILRCVIPGANAGNPIRTLTRSDASVGTRPAGQTACGAALVAGATAGPGWPPAGVAVTVAPARRRPRLSTSRPAATSTGTA